MQDISVIPLAECLDEQLKETLRDMWSHSFYPYQIYLPLPQEDLDRLRTVVPNILGVGVGAWSNQEARVDAVLECCEGDYVAIVPSGFDIARDEEPWIESALQPLMDSDDPTQAFELPGSSENRWAAIFRREQLKRARRLYGHLPIAESVAAAGIRLREPRYEEYPFQFDDLVKAAEEVEEKGNWLYASQIFEYICEKYRNELWMKSRWANTLYHAGRYNEALSIAEELNLKRPTVSTLLMEARVRCKKEDFRGAIDLLKKAEGILEGSELAWSH
jgi:tetratricopeptide (TPR) repeat protein